MPFHVSQDPDYFKTSITRGLNEGLISKTDAELIEQFASTREIKKHNVPVKPIRKAKISQTLVYFRQYLKVQYRDATIEDYRDAIRNLNTSGKAKNTKNDHVRITKAFFTWLIGQKKTRIKENDLKDIVAPGVATPDIDEKELITRDDLMKIIKACRSLRDRALFAVLYESAGRVQEVGQIRWSDIEYMDSGVVSLTLIDEKMSHIGDTEKDKKKRVVPLALSTEYLAAWRTAYPGRADGKSYVFIDTRGDPMSYDAILRQLQRTMRLTDIKKRVNLHLFRKSRLSEMAREKYSDSAIRAVGWNNQSTRMAEVYIKFGKDSVMSEFLERQGLKKPEERKQDNIPRQCSFCFAMSSPISEFCHKCGRPLTIAAEKQIEQERGAIRAAGSEYVRAEDVQTIVEQAVKAALAKK